jgi:7-cyano-7-deazaguanine synthase
MKSVVVLCSGGMDSVVALYQAHRDFPVTGVVSFHYGSKHNDREIPFAAWHARQLGLSHTLLRLDFIGEHFESDLLQKGGAIPEGHYEEMTMKQTVVPFRNGIMLSIAAGLAESRGAAGVVIAAHSGDHAIYPDCREGFMRSMAEAIRLGTYAGIEVIRPFIDLTKSQIAVRGTELGVDFRQTWSCYVGGEIHCGKCGTCVERREAFLLAGLPDPTAYLQTDPLPPKPTANPC